MIGQTLGHYRIEAQLGEGGMGVVYRAIDTHLDRPVAIKVLRTEATADPERKKRFIHEAKSASALNHPNIVTIHDIDSADTSHGSVDFIAMEYVAGRTLDHLIGRKGLGLGETLKYAIQIADALARAHAINIVHRDLKPANIMVTPEGLVKVLDFGLAKLTEREEDEEEQGPTRTLKVAEAPHTEEGVIVGTVAYMSPEQAEGKKIDARSDIFSLGAVLYEMITGRRAFQGETRMSTLAAILNRDPRPASEISPAVPRDLEKIINRCLRKDPARRFQHMDDVKVALEELKEESDSGRAFVSAPPRRAFPAWAIAGVAFLVAITAGLTWWLTRGRGPALGPALTRMTADAGLTAYPALSPDGKLLAYASDRGGEGNLDIWVQQVGGGAPLRLTRDNADDREPTFSPDGTKIAFRSEREGGGIYIVPALGGEERLIAEQGRSPRFSPDGNSIAYWTGDPSTFSHCRTYLIPASGGQLRQLQPDFYSARYPVWSPDGKYLGFWGARDAANQGQPDWLDWWVTSAAGGPAVKPGIYNVFLRRHMTPLVRDPGDWIGNHVLLAAGSGDLASLWQLAISPGSWKVSGEPQRLTFGTGLDFQPEAARDAKGRPAIVFASTSGNPTLWSLPLDANEGKGAGEPRRLTSSAAADIYPWPGPGGKKVAFTSNRSGNQDIWIKDLESGKETQLTATAFDEVAALISPDGARVAYQVFEGPKLSLYVVAPGGGVARQICEDCGPLQCWAPDSKKIVYRKDITGRAHLVLRNVDSGAENVLLRHSQLGLAAARFSPDGRWLAFQTIISSLKRQLFIAPLNDEVAPAEKDWIAVTDGSGLDRNCFWSPNSNLLYFVSERDGFRCFWAQKLDAATKHPAGPPFPVHHFHQARHSLLSFVEVGAIGLSVTADRIIFSMPETTGNVWMARFE